MTNREKYFIKISDALVEVTKEVYEAYYSVERHMSSRIKRNFLPCWSAAEL